MVGVVARVRRVVVGAVVIAVLLGGLGVVAAASGETDGELPFGWFQGDPDPRALTFHTQCPPGHNVDVAYTYDNHTWHAPEAGCAFWDKTVHDWDRVSDVWLVLDTYDEGLALCMILYRGHVAVMDSHRLVGRRECHATAAQLNAL